MESLICPILSVASGNDGPERICVANECALYLPQASKCSLVMLGYKAMLEAQTLRQAQAPARAQQAPVTPSR